MKNAATSFLIRAPCRLLSGHWLKDDSPPEDNEDAENGLHDCYRIPRQSARPAGLGQRWTVSPVALWQVHSAAQAAPMKADPRIPSAFQPAAVTPSLLSW